MNKFVSTYQPVTSDNFYSTINANKNLQMYKVTDNYLQKYASTACKSKEWSSLPFQEFVKVLMGENTPYNSILITWGTGVGKTCGAVQITETLRNAVQMFNRNIYIIAPANLLQNYKESLLSECSGIRIPKDVKPEMRDKYISSAYKFYTYIKFGKLIESIHQQGGPEALMQKFSNCVFVIDEAHNLNNLKEDEETKDEINKNKLKNTIDKKEDEEDIQRKLLNTLGLLFESIKNSKLIMLTATPIRNNIQEIVSLLDLLRLNNNQPRVDQNIAFGKNQINFQYLLQQLKGYISYVRGNSQISFPRIEDPQDATLIKPYPILDPEGRKLNHQLVYTKVIECEMISYQLANYLYYCIPKKYKTNPTNKDMFNNQLTTISNFTLPLLDPSGKVNSALVTKSLDQLFKYNRQLGKYTLLPQGRLDNEPLDKSFFLVEKYLPYFSTKMAKLLTYLSSYEGVHYVYSRLVQYGTNLISFACQLFGWDVVKVNAENEVSYRYTISPNNNIERRCWCGKLESNHSGDHSFSQGHIIMYTGSMNANQKVLKNYLAIVNSEENKRGQLCKVFIGSSVSGEGVNYKRLRYVHIFEPWWNNTVLQQVIGRAARNCSHFDLEPEEQNVIVFRYVSVFPKNFNIDDIAELIPNYNNEVRNTMYNIMQTRETVDMSMYRISEHKDINIAFLTRMLKISAVDCENNYLWNRVWTESEIEELQRDKYYELNGKRYEIHPNAIKYLNRGKDNSPECEYLSCKYKCITDKPAATSVSDDNMLYSYINIDRQKVIVKINQIIKFIQSLHTPIFSLEQLLHYFNVNPNSDNIGYTKFDHYNIYDAITEMLINQDVVFDWNGMTGRLVLLETNDGMMYCFDAYAKYIEKSDTIPEFFKYNNVFTNGSDIEIKMNIVNKPEISNINYETEVMKYNNEISAIINNIKYPDIEKYVKIFELLDNLNGTLYHDLLLTPFNVYYEYYCDKNNIYENLVNDYMIKNYRTTQDALKRFYISWSDITGKDPENVQLPTGEIKIMYHWNIDFYCRYKVNGNWEYFKIVYKSQGSDPYDNFNFSVFNFNFNVKRRYQSDKYYSINDTDIITDIGNIMTEIITLYNKFGKKNAEEQASIVYEYFAPDFFNPNKYNVRIVNGSRGNIKRDNKVDKRSISTGQECTTTTKQSLIRSLQQIQPLNNLPEIKRIIDNIQKDTGVNKVYQNNSQRCKSIEYTFRGLDLQGRNGKRWFYMYGDYDLSNYKI